MFEVSWPENIVQERVERKLQSEIHNRLRQGSLTAWGRPTGPGASSGPQEKIDPEKWCDMTLGDHPVKQEDRPVRMFAWSTISGNTNNRIKYTDIEFSRRQIEQAFPLRLSARKGPNA
jgi:hypothetical protein